MITHSINFNKLLPYSVLYNPPVIFPLNSQLYVVLRNCSFLVDVASFLFKRTAEIHY